MKKVLSFLLIVLFLSLAFMSSVSANTTEEETTARNHGPIYVGLKPLHEYNDPGFIVGFYNRVDWATPESPKYLYSPHLLFGWDIQQAGPVFPFKYTLEIGAFASRAIFDNFSPTFKGFFSGTETGFICGFVDDVLTFYYGDYSPEVMN